jgi:uncharacterized phage-associated protein
MSDIPNFLVPIVGFRSRKAAQLCAKFACAAGGTIEKLKLIKLIYLTERAFIRDHRVPMLFDELYSLPHGPICSSTLNGINGGVQEEIWSEYIARNGNIVVSVHRSDRESLDELSDAEIATAEDVWNQRGHMTASQLRNFTHDNCPEYTEVEDGRVPITYADLLTALGDNRAEEIDREIQEIRRAESVLS